MRTKTFQDYAAQSGRLRLMHTRLVSRETAKVAGRTRPRSLLQSVELLGPVVSGIVSERFERKARLRAVNRATWAAFDNALVMKPARKHQHTHLRAVHALANAAANPRANTRLPILSIDAWADGDGGWTWNDWRCVGYVDCATFETAGRNPRALLRFMREQGFLSLSSAGLFAVDDDQHNLVIVGRRTREPMFAIEYAPAYN